MSHDGRLVLPHRCIDPLSLGAGIFEQNWIFTMTHRIKVGAELHTTNVFYGHIPDEQTGQELVTRTMIEKVTFQRYRATKTVFGSGYVATAIDYSPVEIPEKQYELYDTLQTGWPYSTEGEPYTFIWRVGTAFEPFFEEPGLFYVVIRFLPREGGETEMLTFEVTAK